MSHWAAPETLKNFKFQRILHEDSLAHIVIFLGSLPDLEGNGGEIQAIVRLEKTAFDPAQIPSIFNAPTGIEKVRLEQSTDVVSHSFLWMRFQVIYVTSVYLDVRLVRSWSRTRPEDKYNMPCNRCAYQEGQIWYCSNKPSSNWQKNVVHKTGTVDCT